MPCTVVGTLLTVFLSSQLLGEVGGITLMLQMKKTEVKKVKKIVFSVYPGRNR